jgi:raffinose/stachyose/melibiose transport system substrate-binding protein
MKKAIAIILSIMLIMAIAIPAAAVSVIKVKSMKLDKSSVSLKVGQVYNLKAKFSPANTTQKLLTYVTANKNVATVNSTGKITAIGKGTTTITVSVTANKKISASVKVTVSQVATKVQTIRVQSTFTGADPYTPVWQQTLKDFQTKYPNIKVVDEATSAAGDVFKTKINTDFASGNEPDVAFAFNSTTSKPIVDSGKVISWEKEMVADPTWAANFSPGAIEAGKYSDGKLYALPWIGFYEAMFVNNDVFTNNGLKIPKTWDDILAAIPVLNAKGITPIALSSDEPHYFIEYLLLKMGGTKGHATPFDPSWAPALNLTKVLYDKKAFTEDYVTLKQTSAATLFATKKAAMWVTGSWSRGQIKDILDTTSVVPFPTVPGGKGDPTDVIGGIGSGWYVSKALNDSKDGAAMKFVKYMTNPAILANFIKVAGVPAEKLPASKDMSNFDKSVSDMMGAAKHINSPIGDALGQEVFGAIWRGLPYIATGKKTAEDVLKEAQALVKK